MPPDPPTTLHTLRPYTTARCARRTDSQFMYAPPPPFFNLWIRPWLITTLIHVPASLAACQFWCAASSFCHRQIFSISDIASLISLQMPISTGYRKVQTNIMKGYRRPQQYTYHHWQLGHVTPGLSLLVSVCILMLPMLGLVDEHAQLTTTDHMSPIHQWNVHSRHMTFSHAPLILPSLNNVIPAMAFQNRVVWSNIGCLSYTSSQSDIRHVLPILHLNLPTGLGRRVVRVVVLLLLLMSGDIETNPGPVGEFLY